MHINSISSYNEKSKYSQNFKQLKISMNAPLERLSNKTLASLNDTVGPFLEKTKFVDLEILDDLSWRIKKKGNPFSGIKGKFIVKKPNDGDRSINFSAIHDGFDTEKKKKGRRYNYTVNIHYNENIKNVYKKIKDINSYEEAAFLTKLIDKDLGEINKPAYYRKSKTDIVDELQNKYGDFIK